EEHAPENKITVVGVGAVNMAYATSILMNLADKQGRDAGSPTRQSFLWNTKNCLWQRLHVIKWEKVIFIWSNILNNFKFITPNVKYRPKYKLLAVSSSVDILIYMAWKIILLPNGKKAGISPFKLSWVFREHGDSSVPAWGGVNIAGISLRNLHPDLGTDADKEEVHKQVADSAYEVITVKGHWTESPPPATGLSVADLIENIMKNLR
ncbi:LOW QUALITY PROTEIN: L-lactate dehydrogenase A chain, partial [Galemys pyrenaicus]